MPYQKRTVRIAFPPSVTKYEHLSGVGQAMLINLLRLPTGHNLIRMHREGLIHTSTVIHGLIKGVSDKCSYCMSQTHGGRCNALHDRRGWTKEYLIKVRENTHKARSWYTAAGWKNKAGIEARKKKHINKRIAERHS